MTKGGQADIGTYQPEDTSDYTRVMGPDCGSTSLGIGSPDRSMSPEAEKKDEHGNNGMRKYAREVGDVYPDSPDLYQGVL